MAENTNENEKVFMTLSSIGAIIGFVIPLVVWAVKKDDFSDYTKKFLTDVLNFEIIVFIAALVLSFIPIIGWIANFGVFIFNLIVVLKAFAASQDRKEYSFPFYYQIIK